MIIDKRTFFLLKVARNIASIENEKERMEALDSVKDGSRNMIEVTVNAMRSSKEVVND